jgi:hypothetical protein
VAEKKKRKRKAVVVVYAAVVVIRVLLAENAMRDVCIGCVVHHAKTVSMGA